MFHFSVGLRYIRLMDVPRSLILLSSSKVLTTLLAWYNDNDAYITSITSTAMDDRPQPPPPTDAPHAGDTPRTLRLGDFIIERVLTEVLQLQYR